MTPTRNKLRLVGHLAVEGFGGACLGAWFSLIATYILIAVPLKPVSTLVEEYLGGLIYFGVLPLFGALLGAVIGIVRAWKRYRSSP